MESQGYSWEKEKFVDAYTKEPVYNYEIHYLLFNEPEITKVNDYYADVKRLLVKDEGNRYGYHFSENDFYVYVIAHAYKHYALSGTGLRILTDIAVLKQRFSLDFAYIERELSAMGADGFEKRVRALSKAFLEDPWGTDGPVLSEELVRELEYMVSSGSYGRVDNRFENRMAVLEAEGDSRFLVKLKYTWWRIFPPFEYMQFSTPILKKYPWLLPVEYVWRWIRGIKVKGSALRNEIKLLFRRRKS